MERTGVRRIGRLLFYLRPYVLYSLGSVVLLAVMAAMGTLRLLLIKPIFDKVLNPSAPTTDLLVFPVAHTKYVLNLHFLVPSHFHNAWTVIAYALVVSAVVKSICDYSGTYLVNHAGFGMITDLRNDLYNAVLRRSVGFFQKHTTGALLSTIINDIERVQTAMSSVLAEFLQQSFTFVFTIAAVVALGGKLAWVLLLFVPVVISSARRIGRRVRHTTRTGQDKLAEIQNILHHGQWHREGLWDGDVGDEPLPAGGEAAVRGQSQVGVGAGNQFAADGCDWVSRDCAAAAGGARENPASPDDRGLVYRVSVRGVFAV
jgi:subfamily B ATP-binding cassette protein MsbA